ncbi:MAG TPA: YhdH/YhfP family quinone oxidoreductase [Spirochaetota bacterium]|nr:YhdH/YhfP family quinone oxidoreductase [Spirochaetota bacterium]HPI91294.1 YhdH/YhfP family quinone oxidoreductase [Spirochaetota bacterium]HPR48369.1 YhdH/YhfP family quinone oxidoreductase [Spirochaetota bacterium]
MADNTYRGLVVRESENGAFTCAVENLTTDGLPEGDVLVRVRYSSLNYKDMLSASGNRGVTKKYPHTPGIDGAGTVEQSSSPDFRPGEEVIVTSYDLGMNTSGGLGQYIRVPASWVVKKPATISLRESMIFGTAGFTAGLSVLRLVDHGIKPGSSVLVTGATGGVGSVAVSILSHAGYRVTAVNGLNDETAFLESIGAAEIIPIPDTAESAGRPMLKDKWDAAVDTVGGNMLVFALKSVKADGAVTCCGNAGSADISLTVYPFILRGITLYGIDSQNCPMSRRARTWSMLAEKWKFPWLEKLASEVRLDRAIEQIDRIRAGKHRGRIIVNMQD